MPFALLSGAGPTIVVNTASCPQASSVLPFEIDHIISEKHGGGATEENLALACCYCNRFKGPNISGVDPITGAIARLYHPRRDKWEEHFFWHGATLVGRNPVGRATVAVLRINAAGHLRLRESLRAEGT